MSTCCGPKEAEKYMVYRSGLDTSEAIVIRSLLEGAGITVWITNEHMASLNYAVTADILIREGDKWRADQVIQSVAMSPNDAKTVDMGDLTECHHCGSHDVFNYVGEVPTWGGFFKTRAFPGSPWRKCLACEGYFRVDSNRIMGKMPLSLMWGGTLAAIVWVIMKIINWLKILL